MLSLYKCMAFFRWLNEHFNLLIIPRILRSVKKPLMITDLVKKDSTVEELRFIFEQARDRVKETSEEGDRLYNKSIGIVSICLASITAIAGYLLSDEKTPAVLDISGCITIVVLVVAAVKIKYNILPLGYKGVGSSSEKLLADAFYTNLEGKTPLWHLLANEIAMYNERISINNENNDKRNNVLKEVFQLLYSIPALFAIILLLNFVFNLW